jgi:hypothetical protein
MPKLKMLTGLCGPAISLVRGDEHECDEREASGLIRAGFAVALDGFEPLPLEDEATGEDTPVIDAVAAEAAAKAKADAEAKAKAEADAAAEAEAEAKAKAEAEAAEKPAAAPAKKTGKA